MPGTNWNYSVAIDVLNLVLEKAGDKSLAEPEREKVTAPLGIKETAFYFKPSNRLVTLYAATRADDRSVCVGIRRKFSFICRLTNTTVAGMSGDFPNELVKAIYYK